ncbi:MAG: CheR family methyltransferase [Xenococcaceae cyanobacterium MO_167.B27]|nr:CheR family methyltransferase [Xenococcaceae cyanobacterium MO_167.B27]
MSIFYQGRLLGCYPLGTLKELPSSWIAKAFDVNEQYCLKSAFHKGIKFEAGDIRKQMPDLSFHLILCRNLAFTYFDPRKQQEILQELLHRLLPEGILVIGKKGSTELTVQN